MMGSLVAMEIDYQRRKPGCGCGKWLVCLAVIAISLTLLVVL